MKTIIAISFFLFMSFSLPVNAQNGRRGGGGQNPEYMAQRQTEMMTERLSLTKEQIPTIEKINLETANSFISYRNAHRGDQAAMQKKMRELQKEKDPALKKILTDEQWKNLQKLRSEYPGGCGPGYGRN